MASQSMLAAVRPLKPPELSPSLLLLAFAIEDYVTHSQGKVTHRGSSYLDLSIRLLYVVSFMITVISRKTKLLVPF